MPGPSPRQAPAPGDTFSRAIGTGLEIAAQSAAINPTDAPFRQREGLYRHRSLH